MNALADFQFLQPLWLCLLAPVWALLWLYLRQSPRRSIWARICDPQLLANMTAGQESARGGSLLAWVLGAVLTLGIFAAAAPSWSRQSPIVVEESAARVIALDLSRSMLVQDVRPGRYQHAVAAASELIADGFGGETGLVVFAGSAFVLAPLSRDADTLTAFVEAVHPETMPQDGTNLQQAIELAQSLLAASIDGRGQILLISAGDSEDAAAVQGAADAAAHGNRVSVLAIGSSAGGPVLDDEGGLLRDSGGRVLVSRPNFALLQGIANAGNGFIARAAGELGGDDLLASRIGASQLMQSTGNAALPANQAADDGVWLVWLMLPLALVLFRKNLLWVMLVVVLAPVQQELHAADDSAFWKHSERIAFDAFRRGDYASAAELSANPALRGASFYRRGQYQQALRQFEREDSAGFLYNRANTLVQLERYPEALSAYRRALQLQPELDAARYNKRLLEMFLQQQGAGDGAGNGDADAGMEPNNDGQSAPQSSIGTATELQANPADQQKFGPGLGASSDAGQVDPTERFDGEDEAQERFRLRAQEPGRLPDDELVERWINSLPDTSRELYRRKFLRDYQRQLREPR